MRRFVRRARIPAAVVAWGLLTCCGFACLLVYGNTPGREGSAPAEWPEDVALTRTAESPTLVMFAHPRCPCTRASIAELARLAADVAPKGVSGHVFFSLPEGVDAAWAETDLWTSAAAIPGIRVERDPGGRIADSFGAVTSGQVVLYDATGRLVFSGGITGARGHEGDNRGRDAIEHFIEQGVAIESRTAVFGCELGDQGCDARASSP